MLYLDLSEREALARFTVEVVDGRIPVIASGHIGVTLDEQITELTRIAATGIDCLVFVTNRLDPEHLGSQHLFDIVETLMRELPPDLQLGLYECPVPYRRLLSDDEIAYFAQHPRFVILKDVSCDINTVRRRLELTKDSSLVISNANAAIAYDAMKSGARGFCGVFNNFHPDLYRWLPGRGRDTYRAGERTGPVPGPFCGNRGDGVSEACQGIPPTTGYDSVIVLESRPRRYLREALGVGVYSREN